MFHFCKEDDEKKVDVINLLEMAEDGSLYKMAAMKNGMNNTKLLLCSLYLKAKCSNTIV
jgi:hypothetical protein